ncbi:hypothetical protein AB4865_12500 [Capnocytophaga sp. ARDL2]|uniref:hypothetical protein n=1 Tax=Capnocytophaga sp. ARDL2 TaxID=3238809 RepID=UPI003558F3F2
MAKVSYLVNIEKIERIRNQAVREDWSAEIVEDATIEDLDEEAIAVVRKNFGQKFPDKFEELQT